MSAFGFKPIFTDVNGYKEWIRNWKTLYSNISKRNKEMKMNIKHCQRTDQSKVKNLLIEYKQESAMASKALMLLDEAKARMKMIYDMEIDIKNQNNQFPSVIENARNIVFHFNKKHLEFPDVVPMWVIKVKGQSFYVTHVDCAVPWTTKETPDHKSTKGSIRVPKGSIRFNSDGSCEIY